MVSAAHQLNTHGGGQNNQGGTPMNVEVGGEEESGNGWGDETMGPTPNQTSGRKKTNLGGEFKVWLARVK